MGELSAPGSHLYVEIATPLQGNLTDREVADDGTDRTVGLLRSGPPIPPHDWLADHGWEPAARTLADLADRHGRQVTRFFDPSRGGATVWYFDCAR